jgi:hypothetical protein
MKVRLMYVQLARNMDIRERVPRFYTKVVDAVIDGQH